MLNRDTGHRRDYGRNPYPGYDDVNSSPFLFDGEADDRLPAQARVVSVRRNGDSLVIPHDRLLDERVVVTEVDGVNIVAFLTPGTASGLEAGTVAGGRDVGAVGVYDPTVDGRSLTFEPVEGAGFTDVETGSTWDILGRAVEGPLAGSRLEPIEHLDTFWFAIAAFEPNTRIV